MGADTSSGRQDNPRSVGTHGIQPPTGQGPLSGVRVVEFSGIGPGPFCAMMLSDMGADVVRIDRSIEDDYPNPVINRGRTAILLDLKTEQGRATALAAMDHADVVIEGYRPGVMERLGLGPDIALGRNPRLVYGRMTGWGQSGPLAARAGHDINYIALTGALEEIGYSDRPPVPPLNLLGDFGGGGTYLAFGIVAALVERFRSGRGQIVDAAIVDGTASLMAMFSGMAANGFPMGRGANMLGGAGAHYRCYACSDGRYIALGTIEPQFWGNLATALGLTEAEASRHPADAETLRTRLEEIFLTASQQQWCERLEHLDVCFAPVLGLSEAPSHPHNRERGVYQRIDGVDHPAPAPRFSRTPGAIGGPAPARGEGGADRLRAWGVELP